MTESSDVVIVGCGISGLSAAYHLVMNDFPGRIVVLESRPEIGGRISSTTTKYECRNIELGANWIHGIMGNPIYDLAKKHNLIDTKTTGAAYIVEARSSNGNKIDTNLVEEVYQKYYYFIKRCENYYKLGQFIEAQVQQYENSVGQHLRADIDTWISSLKDTDSETKRLIQSIINTLVNRETCISGCHSVDELSLKDYGSYVELPGGDTTHPKGYIQILNVLLDEIKQKVATHSSLGYKLNGIDGKYLSILLSHRVNKINWEGVATSSDGNTSNKSRPVVEVVCDNGSTFRCNHLIVTLPLGVLKKDALNLFEPRLPPCKLQAIKNLGFGVVNKVFLEYSLPLNNFINPNINETLVVLDEVNGQKDKWFHKNYSIYKLSNHLLLLWASGEEALQLEQLSEDVINEELTQFLQQLYSNKQFPKADNVIVTRWGTDPHSLGSYSFISTDSSIRDIEALSRPIYADSAKAKPIIQFAGEATHPSFYSTVHGAFLSGRRAANYLSGNKNGISSNILSKM